MRWVHLHGPSSIINQVFCNFHSILDYLLCLFKDTGARLTLQVSGFDYLDVAVQLYYIDPAGGRRPNPSLADYRDYTEMEKLK